MHKNVVIIGGGLGGLTTGALLAKSGDKVTVLEQHNIVGGCATVFKRKDFTCEVGLHEMDGVYTNHNIKESFKKLDVYQNIEFIKPDEFFKVYTKNSQFIMPDSKDEAMKELNKKFPSEKRAINKYFKLLDDISQRYDRLESAKWYEMVLFPFFFFPILKYKSKSVSDVLDTLTDNDELKLILNTNVQYYNDTPNTLCFLLHAVAQNSYFNDGGYFIKGGSYKLSEYLEKVIKENGGEVITKAMVVKASKDEVMYEKKGEEVKIKADKIVSNISPKDTYKLFDVEYKEDKQIAESITTIYLGFSKNLKALYGKRAYSNFILDSMQSDKEFEDMAKKDVIERGFVFVDYSQIDSALVEQSKSFGAVCYIDEMRNWDKLDKGEYKEKKQKLLDTTLLKLEKYYPNIKEVVEYAEVATPKTMQRYLKTPNGTAYGYKPTPKQFFRIPKLKSKKIDNLYFTGQFVIGGGFSATIISAKMCVDELLKDI